MKERLSRGHFYGSLLGKQEHGGLTLTDYLYPAAMQVAKHQHESPYFCIVLQGGYDESFDRNNRVCGPSTVTVHPSGEYHSDRFHGAGGRIFSVEAEAGWSIRLGRLANIFEKPAEFKGGSLAALLMKMYAEFRLSDAASHLAIEGLSLEVVAEATRGLRPADKKPPQWLRNAREYIDAHSTSHITIGTISEQAGVHPVHLVREFRKHFRMTIGEYVRSRRIDYACGQLTSPEIPLIEIALNAGFSQQSHFSRAFKQITGMSPGEYRRTMGAVR